MSHDTSRIRFDPRDHYQGVLMQQGRPLTDADWNEATAQRLRREQALGLDTFGPAVVPSTTPNAFAVTAVVGGFTVGVGRLYVDGLLAENHGSGPVAWDAQLEQTVGTAPLAYASQPHWPAPPALPALPYAVVLDVWQREVGPWEDERLLEPALGGVDTTARVQTVWQVHAVPVAAGTTCATPWAPPAPSPARLSSAAVVVPGAANPCLVPPGGGYQGSENQLYRIEVHDGGPLGVATFKWSRDNASVQARVVNLLDLSHLVVDSIGRDDVLGFSAGDWIEILDDRLELQGQASADGAPGLLRQIVAGGVDAATRTITLAQPLPAGTFPVDAQGRPTGGRHCRIRRWDQRGAVRRADGTVLQDLAAPGSSGAISVPAAGVQVVLEAGVAVDFSLAVAGGRFRSGDWWVVAARTGDAGVEVLTNAPPRGVHHHHAKLAIVTAAGVLDCRTPWPPAGCCTRVVAPGQSIQAAIDALPPEGGCVCLKSGLHRITATLTIDRPNVQLHGESPGTRVQGDGLVALLTVTGTQNVEVAQIEFEALSCPAGASLFVGSGTDHLTVRDCAFIYAGPPGSNCTGAGLLYGRNADIDRCTFRACATGISSQNSLGRLRVTGSTFEAQRDGGVSVSPYGVDASGYDAVAIEGNRFVDFHTAVRLSPGLVTARVHGNDIRRQGLPAALAVDTPVDDMLWAVQALCNAARIDGNRIEAPSVPHGGVLARGARTAVHDNEIVGADGGASLAGPIGVCVGGSALAVYGEGSVVSGNACRNLTIAVLVEDSAEVTVRGTTVRNDPGANGTPQGLGIVCRRSRSAVIADHALQDVLLPFSLQGGSLNQVCGNAIDRAVVALLVVDEAEFECSHNRVDGAGLAGLVDFMPDGTHRYVGNRLRHCGGGADALAFGIAVLDFSGTSALVVQGNEILDTGIADAATGFGGATAVGVGAALVAHAQVSDNRIAYSQSMPNLDRTLEHRALALVGPLAVTVAFGADPLTIANGSAQVHGNHFEGPGRPHLVELRRFDLPSPLPNDQVWTGFDRVSFSNNHCLHDETTADAATVSLRGGNQLAVHGNHQTAGPLVRSFHLGNRPNATVIGNVTVGNFVGVATTVPAPLANFNVNL